MREAEPLPSAELSRRSFLVELARGAGLLTLGGLTGAALVQAEEAFVWQIDPERCIRCGKCATHCVMGPSAVKCMHVYGMCGYCELCTGYFEPKPLALNEGAENQLCPTGAIQRVFIEDPYYEYHIQEEACIGCGKCVEGCTAFGNGSLQLQIKPERCLNCNACGIAEVCPAQAIRRVPASQPYLLLRPEPTPPSAQPVQREATA